LNKLDCENIKISKNPDGIKLGVRVIPNSSRCEICGVIDENLKIKLDVPPVDGKANEKLVKFLSKTLNIAKTNISIISGETSKNKKIFIKGNPDELQIILQKFL